MDLTHDPSKPTLSPLLPPFNDVPYNQPIANFRYATDLNRGVVRWLWPDRIPAGRLALLVGDPGVGKSLLLADLAARHSAGLGFPTPQPHIAEPDPIHAVSPTRNPHSAMNSIQNPNSKIQNIPGNPHSAMDPTQTPKPKTQNAQPAGVIFVSPEDSPSATLQPRLVAAGARLDHILLIDGVRADKYQDRAELPFTLPEHFEMLETAIGAMHPPRLVVLDPLSALLPLQMRGTSHLAGVLGRLSRLAERCDAAIIAVAHLVKTGTQHVLYRVRGSLTMSGAARSIFHLAADPLDPARRILSTIKSVYAAPPPPLFFTIAPGPKLRWSESSDDSMSGVALRASLMTTTPEHHSALTEAAAWLLDFLSAGPRESNEVFTAAARDGHHSGTLKRAKQLLGARSIKPDRQSPWQWELAERPILKGSK